MLANGFVGGSGGAPMIEEEEPEEVEGMELDEDEVEIAEGDADDDDDNVVGTWFDGPAPLRLRIGILGLMISSSPSS
jgi:hypothetical protein